MGRNNPQTIHIVAGPTGGGKSAKAMELARALGGVIINCDSLQIYDDLPILTARPSAEDLKSVPHRLYGTLHPNEVCSAGHWREMAEPVIEAVLAEGRTPIICGGTGLYLKALMEGLSPMPDIPDEVRARAIKMQEEWDAPTLHAHLQDRDPLMAARLDPNNKARLVRAWEVLEATGKSLAVWQELERLAPPAHWRFEVHKVLPEREELYRRCDTRFEKMLEMGALAEVEAFAGRIESGEVQPHVPLTKALGFKQLWAFLRGELDRETAIEQSQTTTRRYAKRQMTWIRNQLMSAKKNIASAKETG